MDVFRNGVYHHISVDCLIMRVQGRARDPVIIKTFIQIVSAMNLAFLKGYFFKILHNIQIAPMA